MRRFLLLAIVASVAPSARAAAQATPAVHTTGAFFALSVADLAASAKWYEEKLGLRVVMRAPKQNGAAATALEGGGLIVELVQQDAAMSLRQAAPGVNATYLVHGIFKAGMIVEDLDRTISTLRQRGVEIAMGPFPAREGQRANVIIRDNSGNLIQLFGR